MRPDFSLNTLSRKDPTPCHYNTVHPRNRHAGTPKPERTRNLRSGLYAYIYEIAHTAQSGAVILFDSHSIPLAPPPPSGGSMLITIIRSIIIVMKTSDETRQRR